MKDLALHILDLAQNSLRAGARLIEIHLVEEAEKDLFRVTIADDGKGIPAGNLERVLDPFYTTRTTRRVGLGLPLFEAAARRSGGGLTVTSTPGRGTRLEATFQLRNWDRPPLGDMAETILTLIAANPDVDFLYRQKRNGKEFTFDTRQIKAVLEEVPINHPEVIGYLRRELRDNLNEG
ncbi:MAG: ATP-binding protein [Firmicutes bacterium]|nr:ATP-binding protein [Bacillota bacterium]